ncbi:MAG: hypothetical protein H6672_17735 [Anaerolineaceae bacterium]|nr:hypothetical protein [Anaerolineaceae bacterium]
MMLAFTYACPARRWRAAIEAVGTKEQKLRLLHLFAEGDEPVWGRWRSLNPAQGRIIIYHHHRRF